VSLLTLPRPHSLRQPALDLVPAARGWWRWESAIALAILAGCLLVDLAILTIGIDDLDDGYFAQQAVRVAHGEIPYRDFASLYTPGMAYLHGVLLEMMGGPYLLGPRLLSLGFRALLAFLLYVVARPLVSRPIWAALPGVFVLIGFDSAPVLWEPHPGWPSAALCVLAAWCATRSNSRAWLLSSGLAAGAAYAFKQNAGVFILLALVIYLRRRAVLPVVGFVAITLTWLLPLVLAIDGQVLLLAPLVGAVNQASLRSSPEPTVLIPVACLLGGLVLARREKPLRWYVLAGACVFATQYPRGDTIHLAWAAPLLLAVGAVVLSRLPLGPALAALGLAAMLCLPSLQFRLGAVRLATATVVGVPYADGLRGRDATRSDLVNTVADVRARTSPDEPIFVYPTSPLLYVLAERPNPTRFDHLNPGAATPAEIQDTIATLAAADVRVVVISTYWRAVWGPPGDNAPLEQWIETGYHEEADFGQYIVLARNQ
jgi:hypothetical protein